MDLGETAFIRPILRSGKSQRVRNYFKYNRH
jgi:hypothetical protein